MAPRPRDLFRWLVGAPAAGAGELTAAATPLRVGRDRIVPASASWQDEVWRYFDELAEFGYGVTWLADMVGRCRLLAAAAPLGDGDEPAPIDLDDPDQAVDANLAEARLVAALVAELCGGIGGQAQMMKTVATHLTVPGEGWLIGEQVDELGGVTRWEVRSTDELRSRQGGSAASNGNGTSSSPGVEVIDEHGSGAGAVKWRPLEPDSLVVRIWRPHERYRHLADSPARHARQPMRELELANRRIQADYLSRLATAGVWLLPEELTFPTDPKYSDEPDPFAAELVETAATAIANPGTAAAVIPIPVRVPADQIQALKDGFIDFTTKGDEKLLEKRESAIKRLATALDLPAEVLLGISDLNHWSAWIVSENGITQHIAPTVELICQCLTVGYLWPRLAAAGVENPARWLIWYDPSELTVRPDRSDDAVALYDRLELSGDALRRETGFSEADRPDDEELRRLILVKAATDPNFATAVLAALGLAEPADVVPPPAPREDGAAEPPEEPSDQERRGPPPPPAAGPPPRTARRPGARHAETR